MLDSIGLSADQNTTTILQIDWLQNSIEQHSLGLPDVPAGSVIWYEENMWDASGFPVFSGYHKFTFRKESSKGVYHFVRHYDASHNYKYHYHNEKTYFAPCPNHIHETLFFSWLEIKKLCRDIHTALPEFLCESEQNEFVELLKYSLEMFPMPLVYIGLQKYSQVGLYLRFQCYIQCTTFK